MVALTILGMNAGLGFRTTPASPDMNCKHAECTENAWILLTHFAEAKANSSAVLNDNIGYFDVKNDMERASSTNPKSHEGGYGDLGIRNKKTNISVDVNLLTM